MGGWGLEEKAAIEECAAELWRHASALLREERHTRAHWGPPDEMSACGLIQPRRASQA